MQIFQMQRILADFIRFDPPNPRSIFTSATV
jgi:hypothetical protein